MSPKQVEALLALLKAAYPRQIIEEETVQAYAALLGDLPFKAAQRAVRAHLAESPYFPTVAEIRMRVAEDAAGLPAPEEAWSMVAGCIPQVQRRLQWDPWPQVPHPVVARAVADIGWEELAFGRNPAATRAQFLEQYRHHRQAALRPYLHGAVVPPVLPAAPPAAPPVALERPATRRALPALTPEERDANLRRLARMVRKVLRNGVLGPEDAEPSRRPVPDAMAVGCPGAGGEGFPYPPPAGDAS